MALQNVLIATATGGDRDAARYKGLRDYFLEAISVESLCQGLPDQAKRLSLEARLLGLIQGVRHRRYGHPD